MNPGTHRLPDTRRTPITRRRFVTLIAAAGTSLLAACGGDDEPAATTAPTRAATTPSAGTTPAAAATAPASGGTGTGTGTGTPAASPGSAGAAGTPKRGGTMILALDGNPPLLNTAISTGGTDGWVAQKIQQGLIYLDKTLTPQPQLAQKWEISSDGLQYTFTLQQGVKWHDGQPFTSADVRFTMLDVVAKYHPLGPSNFGQVDTVETPNELTAVVKFKQVYGPFMNALEVGNCALVPKHIFEGKDVPKDPHTLTNPIGTGPFVLKDWKAGESLTLERNPNYWKQNKPYLDRLIFKIIPQAASRTAALKAGEIDYIPDYMFDKADFASIKSDAKFQNRLGLGAPENTLIILNNRFKPLDDKRVRQALYTALDRQYIIDTTTFGLGDVAKSSITPQFPWAYNPKVDLSKQYAFDPAKANKMLDDAGVARGSGNRRFTVRLVFDTARAGYAQWAEIVRAQWGAVGVEVSLVPVERQVMIDQVFMKWDFEATLQAYGTFGDPAAGIARLYVSTSIVQRAFTNASGYSNPTVDDLFAKGAQRAKPEERAQFYYQVQEILAEDVPTLPITDIAHVDVASVKFQLADTLWAQGYSSSAWDDVWQK